MSLSAALTPVKQRKMAEGQFVADLAGLFERRGILTGSAFDDAQFEHLLRDSDSFRSQLFSLCTAISHMSDHDLTGDELVGLLARALGLNNSDALPGDLKMLFLSGLDAWNTRTLAQQDEWPPVKKPVASVTVMPAASDSNVVVRPPGIPTLQEAIETARSRSLEISQERSQESGHERPLQLEAPSSGADVNTLAIQELNALLGEIEDRMKRLQPQLISAGARAAEPAPAELLSLAAREAAFLERHSYLGPRRVPQVIDQVAVPVLAITDPEEAAEQKTEEPAASEPELRLMPRSYVESDEPGPPSPSVPDRLRLKTYLALAVVVTIALIGTPISAVVAYRYMHPLYIYDQAPQPQTPPAAAQPASDEEAASPAKSASSADPAVRAHKPQPVKRKPPVAVWPPPPQQ